MSKRPAVFVDRDGTLIREKNYLDDPAKLKLIAGSVQALKALKKAGYKVVVITNQSGVGRGYFTLATLKRIHARLNTVLKAAGAPVDGLFVCIHSPEKNCPCRKPKPLLVTRAAKALKLDLSRSYLVGDSTADIGCAENAGVTGILVRTGKGGRDKKCPKARPVRRCRNLAAAARWILRQKNSS